MAFKIKCGINRRVEVVFMSGEDLPLPGVDGGMQNGGLQLIGFTLMYIDQLQFEIAGDLIREKFGQSIETEQRFVIGAEDLMSGSAEDFDRIAPLCIIPLPEAHYVRADGL